MTTSQPLLTMSGAWALSYHPLHGNGMLDSTRSVRVVRSEPSLCASLPQVAATSKSRTAWYRIPYMQILMAIVLGVVAGHLFPKETQSLKVLGDFFTRLLRMMIAPTIFCTVVHGIGSIGDMRRLGRTGFRTLLYFEIVSTLALIIGLVVVNVVKPGVGLHIDPRTLDPSVGQSFLHKAQGSESKDFLLNLIPTSFVGAFTSGNLLHVLFVAVITALALPLLPGKGQGILQFIDAGRKLCMSMLGIIVKLAPLGAFGAMAYTVGHFGIGSLSKLALLMGCFYATAALFVGLVLGAIVRWTGRSLLKFLAYIKDELLLVLGTGSSETALPGMMRKLESLGCSRATVGLVLPTGFSFNLDGTNIYLTMAVIFLAQATHTPLSFAQQIGLLLAALLTSKGSAAVAGAGFVALAATVQTIPGLPLESLAILIGIDRFMGEGRAITNLIGNGVATLAISKWEGELSAAAEPTSNPVGPCR